MKVAATAIVALSLGLASVGIAQADEANYPEIVTPSTQTRAEVVQALQVAQSQGLVTTGEHTDYPRLQNDGSSLTRAQVLNELQQAKSAGLVSIGEDNQYPNVL
ncbi:DUF4148 domain-containing protein [Castellaniella sp.]|uniref:DUF4148 domain-containing protein n=1 Tax=Castellaniella sp. TaxID=1955812 RepID=UPI003C71BF45